MIHPGKKIIEEIRNRGWTQKQFAVFVGKKNSEVNELIKGKRNITIQWDYILSQVLGTPEKYWINMQTDYDYEQMKQQKKKEEENNVQSFEVVENIPKNISKNIQDDVSNGFQNKDLKPQKEETHVDDNKKTNISKDEIQNNDETIPQEETNIQKQFSEDISQKELEHKKEMKKIFINF